MKELIFVYNADSSIWNGTLDVMHKVFSPSTYSCHLCRIIYGALSVKSKWAQFIKELPVTTSFFHRDEFAIKYGIKEDLPAVFFLNNDQLELLISPREMRELNLKSLQERIKKFLELSTY
jgi:hypothetical protein